MYLIIGTYLLVGVLINFLIDLLFDLLERRSSEVNILIEGDLERFDNFTKFLVMLFWPIVIIYILLSILNEYTK